MYLLILKTIWEDAEKNNTATNPVVLDSTGVQITFADGLYDIAIRDSGGSVVHTYQKLSFITEGNFGLGINAEDFGTGDNADAISQAILSAGGADSTVFLNPKNWLIDQNLSVPSNINLVYRFGAYTTVNAGITFTLNGKLEAPLYNIFRGAGTVTLNSNINEIPTIWLQTAVDGNRGFLGDVTFDTDTMFIDSSNNRVGIGDITPSTILDIQGNSATITLNGRNALTSGAEGSINIFGARNTDDETFGSINFNNFDDNATSTDILSSTIDAVRDGGDGSGLVISTKVAGGALTERIRFTEDGFIGISDSDPNFGLDVDGDVRIQDPHRLRFNGTGASDSDVNIFRSAANTLQVAGDPTPSDGNFDVLNRLSAIKSDIARRTIKIASVANAGTSINAAINELGPGGGGIIYCPTGTYLIDVAITTNSFRSITLIGDGPDLTIFSSEITGAMFTQAGQDDVKLFGIHFNGAGSSTATECYQNTGTNKSLVVRNCKFSGASSVLLDNPPPRSEIEFCEFDIPASVIGVDNLEDLSIVRFCDFSGNVASSIGVRPSGVNTNIQRNNFTNLVNAMELQMSNITNLNIRQNVITTCSIGIEGNAVFAEGIEIIQNEFNGCTSRSIKLGRINGYSIERNRFIDQTGADVIVIEKTIKGKISANELENCDVSGSFINPCTSSESSLKVTAIIESNEIANGTATVGINAETQLTTSQANQCLQIRGNQLIENVFVESVISTQNERSIVSNNQIRDFNSTEAASVLYGIRLRTNAEGSILEGNVVAESSIASDSQVEGLSCDADNCVISNNNIDISVSSTANTTGIAVAATTSNIHNNRIINTNTGAGVGNAFDVSTTNGVLTGNVTVGSEATGTRTITVVSNNDPV